MGFQVTAHVTKLLNITTTSWTGEVNDLNTGRDRLVQQVQIVINIIFWWESAPASTTALTEEFDGASWTETSDMNTASFFNWSWYNN